MRCGVGHRRSSDPMLLWLWCRPAGAAPFRPLTWEPPYAASAAPKRQKKFCSNLPAYHYRKAICSLFIHHWVHYRKESPANFLFFFSFCTHILWARSLSQNQEEGKQSSRKAAVFWSGHHGALDRNQLCALSVRSAFWPRGPQQTSGDFLNNGLGRNSCGFPTPGMALFANMLQKRCFRLITKNGMPPCYYRPRNTSTYKLGLLSESS